MAVDLHYTAASAADATYLKLGSTSGAAITIDWGDGSAADVVTPSTSGRTQYNHTYASAGSYTVSLTGATGDVAQLESEHVAGWDFDIAALSGMTGMIKLYLYNSSVSGDIAALSGMTGMDTLYLYNNGSVSGDIAALSGMTVVTTLDLGVTSVSGDIAALSGMTGMINLYLYSSSVSGDIAALSGMTVVNTLNLYNTSVSGDIAVLSGMTGMINLYLGTSVSGDIAALSGMTGMINLYLYNSSVSGDIAALSSMTVVTYLNLVGTSVSGPTAQPESDPLTMTTFTPDTAPSPTAGESGGIGFVVGSCEYAPAGTGGECLFTNLYLAVTRRHTGDAQITVTPYVDGTAKPAVTITLASTGGDTKSEVHEVPLTEPATRIGRHSLRGERFSFAITSASGVPNGALVVEGAELEWEPVRELKEAVVG